MPTSKVTYLGELRTSSIHLQSGSEIISDAPIDNNGKGEAFSPTDTVANGLASCMFTVMGIKAREMGLIFRFNSRSDKSDGSRSEKDFRNSRNIQHEHRSR